MIIVEGIDGVGKTTFVKEFIANGYENHHFPHDKTTKDIQSKYLNVLTESKNYNKFIMDRSFITEMVYGVVLRGKSRIERTGFEMLLSTYAKKGCQIIYLTASKDILLYRKENDVDDFRLLDKFYKELSNEYDEVMRKVKTYIPIKQVCTDNMTKPLCKKIVNTIINTNER